jgi:hypothetical protein
VKYWEFKKKEDIEIVKEFKEKVFKVSLLGRTYLEDGTSLPLRYSNSSGLSVEERIKNSLANTELDDPNIRVGGYSNSKISTLKEWTKGANRSLLVLERQLVLSLVVCLLLSLVVLIVVKLLMVRI